MESAYVIEFLQEAALIADRIDGDQIEAIASVLATVKARGGRVFFAGSGGGAGHASHATCDFRKLLGIESYSVSENVTELTARINDESWEESYSSWLKASRFGSKDCLFVFSVGGGDADRGVSMQLVRAIDYAREVGAAVVGVAGRDGGHLARNGVAVLIPSIHRGNVTAQTEGFQAVVWHLLLGHPSLMAARPVWESIEGS
ncbi:SIS domain-containing protein [Ferrimicrobium sp.]|uniref:SIS domain-containing protein n=1 Tax=Ferrimicrobium sp. TaxID=2926050 RepID=UPI00261562F9|nr:SIS domain-containing protein [Ferrimicrobium sp.]